MKLKIWTYVTLAVAIGLDYYLFSRIKFSIDEERRIVNSEAAVIAKLKVIQEAELAYQEVYGKYTSNWDSLINFIETGTYYVTERSEEIVMRPYGGDSTIVHIDTVGAITAKDYIFKAYHNIYTADSGQFVGLNVKMGQRVLKGQRVYTMINSTNNKQVEHTSKEDGIVDQIMELSGNVAKSELVMILLEK